MRKYLLAATAAAGILTVAQPAYAQSAGDKIAGSYICVFHSGAVSRGAVQSEAKRAVGSAGLLKRVYSVALRGFATTMSEQAVANMRAKNPKIAYCEQDQVVTAIKVTAAGKPGSGVQPAESTPWGIARVGHGKNQGVDGTSYGTAWVIDTGIDLGHPDLNTNDTRHRNFVAREESAQDLNGHGTHVAGTIAAIDNEIGVIGVAPGAKVVAVRVLNRNGRGTTSGVIDGVDYVADVGQAGDVANMSLGGGVSTALDTAVINAAKGGVRFALAAGNEADHANNHSPGRANGDNVFTVSAFSQGTTASPDRWASFSNYGNPPIDYAEPGVSIKSTWVGGGYNTISGTSMATPHLAGLLLLGDVRSGGTVNGDPSAPADTIGVH